MLSLIEALELQYRSGDWVPGCCGAETWTTRRDGRESLYVWQQSSGRHGWLGRDDIVYQDYEMSIVMD